MLEKLAHRRIDALHCCRIFNPLAAAGAIFAFALEKLGSVNTLIKRFSTCEEIPELVWFRCTPACECVTGANGLIDGGYLAQ
jgi:hypothetical protein